MMHRIKLKMFLRRRPSTFLLYVIMHFGILFASIVIAEIISYVCMYFGILPKLVASRAPAILIFMVLISVFVGTTLCAIVGEFVLRPLYNLVEAMKEVTSGNFNVRLQAGGTREIGRVSAYFNEMAKELSSVETLRADFVSNISHEFKTPVASIKGFAKRLKKDNLPEQQRHEYLDIIISESERLTKLSGNILLLSRLESTDKIADEAANYLDEQLRRTVLLLEPQFQKKQLKVDIDIEEVQIVTNEELLRHLWINLLENAIKFSPVDGTVGVSLKSQDNGVVISISDTGAGMDEEVKKHIYEKFYQGDHSRSSEGNGLGLSLVKRILELENGRITVDSEPGKGACFTVFLPTPSIK